MGLQFGSLFSKKQTGLPATAVKKHATTSPLFGKMDDKEANIACNLNAMASLKTDIDNSQKNEFA